MVYPTPDTTPTNVFEVHSEAVTALDSRGPSSELSDAPALLLPDTGPFASVVSTDAVSFPAPPEINIDYAPPSRRPFAEGSHIDSLSAPTSSARFRARSDGSGGLQRSVSDRSRAKSDSLFRYSSSDLADQDGTLADSNRGPLNPNRVARRSAIFQCTLCPKRFTRAYNLRSHLRTHTDNQPFVCSVCGKSFARQHDRKRHESLHSGEKKFVCRGPLKNDTQWGCGRRFARADALGRHFRSEAGRICIGPLLEEEIREREGFKQALSGGIVPENVLSDEKATKRRRIEPTSMLPPPPPASSSVQSRHPQTKGSSFLDSLPAALIAQYPALQSLDWNQMSLPAEDFHDSGYPGSSSFETESFEDSRGPNTYLGNPTLHDQSLSREQVDSVGSINQRNLISIFDDKDLKDTLERHQLPTALDFQVITIEEDEESDVADSENRRATCLSNKPLTSGQEGDLGPRHIYLARSLSQAESQSPLHGPEAKAAPVTTAQSFSQPLPSDSGYQSGMGTDTESVCSLDSAGSSLGLPRDFLQEFIAFFGDILIKKAGAHGWASYALAHHSSEFIERHFHSLLKRYTEELVEDREGSFNIAHQSQQALIENQQDQQILQGAIKLVRRYRPKIARYFCDNAVTTSITEESLTARLQALSKQLSLTEKLGLFNKTAPGSRDLAEDSSDVLIDDDMDDVLAHNHAMRDILVSSKAFDHLATDLRRTFYGGKRDAMDRIESTVRNCLSQALDTEATPVAVYRIEWSVPSFMRTQYEDSAPHISKVVTLSGSALYAQAATCLEYATTVWPCTGSYFVEAINALRDGQKEHWVAYQGFKWQLHEITYEGNNDAISAAVVTAEGPTERVIELAQQLAWIGSALSLSPYQDELSYCKPILEVAPPWSGIPTTIRFEHERLHATEHACWLPMFCGASIAHGFPIPERDDETGLEIAPSLMAAITGIQHAVEYKDGVVMKGFSTMFVPTKRTNDRVQWHLISSGDADVRLSYQEGLSRCSNRLTTKDFGLEELPKCRAIVGWCTAAVSLLGSESANYENIDYSGAEDADTPLKFAGGTLGFQQFAVAQLDFRLGIKDGKSHFQRSGPFQRIISAACKTPIVLFDTSERRAWLVPASNVMLHIAQHRHWLEPFEVEGKTVDLLALGKNDCSTKGLLLKSAPTRLFDHEEYTLKDLILNIWSILEFLIDQNVVREQANPGTSIKGTLRESLSGFEFKAVVEERSPFRQKKIIMNKTCGGWPMLARDIDALVLFANGFEDLIQPQQERTRDLCNLWRSVPKWKDYLATSVSTIKDLYDVAGSRLDMKFLTSTRLQWDRGSSAVFEACQYPGAYRCRCNRLQQIVPKAAIGAVVPPGALVDEGAIIFGHSGSMLQDVVPKQRAVTSDGLYSQPNITLTPALSRIDQDDSCSVLSDDEPAMRSGSDTTAESLPSSKTSFTSRGSMTQAPDDMDIDQNDTTCARKRSWQSHETSATLGGEQNNDVTNSTKRAKCEGNLELCSQQSSDVIQQPGGCVNPRGLRRVEHTRQLRHTS